MDENSYLVVFYDMVHCYAYIKDENLCKYYYSNNYIRKVLSKICIKCFKGKGLYLLFSRQWKDKVKYVKNIIFTDNCYNGKMAKYVKKENPECRVIFCYRNIVDDRNMYILNDKNIDEFWTFDNRDSQKYNIKFFPQFYYMCLSDAKLENTPIVYDSIFLGAAKDREGIINDIKGNLENKNLKCYVKIVHNKKEAMSYSDYLDLITKTKSIIDIVGKDQNGLTLRCLEALFYSKKLITNNINIEQYDFYNPNNIFIIGKDSYNDINDFVNSPFDNSNQEKYIEKYSYENWVRTLINN